MHSALALVPAPCKSGSMRALACNLSTQEVEAAHQEFKVNILDFTVGSEPGWAM